MSKEIKSINKWEEDAILNGLNFVYRPIPGIKRGEAIFKETFINEQGTKSFAKFMKWESRPLEHYKDIELEFTVGDYFIINNVKYVIIKLKNESYSLDDLEDSFENRYKSDYQAESKTLLVRYYFKKS